MHGDLGDVAGYRWVIQSQYDNRFRGLKPEQVSLQREACASYLDRVLRALQLPDEGTHLDVGCGAGLAALAVARARPAMRVVGVDASATAVELARETAARERLANTEFVEGDAESPPLGPHDRATALSVFNLMPDKRAALTAWRHTMRPGGRLVLADAFTLRGPATNGTGATTDPAFTLLLNRTGWRAVHREDLTPHIRRLHTRGAWPWPEYVRDGYRYMLHGLEARP